jgi:hypothetical protein
MIKQQIDLRILEHLHISYLMMHIEIVYAKITPLHYLGRDACFCPLDLMGCSHHFLQGAKVAF